MPADVASSRSTTISALADVTRRNIQNQLLKTINEQAEERGTEWTSLRPKADPG
jgi:hypothetical protein